jgi:hypothetical protein
MTHARKIIALLIAPLLLCGLAGCYYPAYPAPYAQPAPAPAYYQQPGYYYPQPAYYAPYPTVVDGGFYVGGGGHHRWH